MSLWVRSSPRATEPNTRRLRAPYYAAIRRMSLRFCCRSMAAADPHCRRLTGIDRWGECERHCNEVLRTTDARSILCGKAVENKEPRPRRTGARAPTWPTPTTHQYKYLIIKDLLAEMVGFEPEMTL